MPEAKIFKRENKMRGLNAVIWISGYTDAMKGVHQARYKGHPDEQLYEAGHAEGTKDRITAADEMARKRVETAKAA